MKTNKKTSGTIRNATPKTPHTSFLLKSTKEHCLMGIKGTVRRSTDSHFIHANLDTDVIVTEEPLDPFSREKPEELY